MSDVWSITHSYRDANCSGTKVELFPGEQSAKGHVRELWHRHIDESNYFQVRNIRAMRLEPVKLSEYDVTPLDGPVHESDEVSIGPWFEWVEVAIDWPGLPDWVQP